MARALVIGAAGLLGREVVRVLRASEHDVVAVGRDARDGALRFDAERDAAQNLFRDRVDVVVNCAGVLASELDESDPSQVQRAEKVNAAFPHDLATAAAEAGARVVHVSTDAVFAADAGRCLEDDVRFADDVYGATKRRGEPRRANAISLRCSFVGRDPRRGRGLLEWLLSRPAGATVEGYVDQAWNGLASGQVAAVCAALADEERFALARSEGPVHHLFEDPPLTKHELLALCAHTFDLQLTVVPRRSGRPTTRVLGTRHATLSEYLQSLPPRALELAALARRGDALDG